MAGDDDEEEKKEDDEPKVSEVHPNGKEKTEYEKIVEM
jgi:hypothetical protein